LVVSRNPLLSLKSLPALTLRRARLRELLATKPEQLVPWLGDVVERARRGMTQDGLTMVALASLLAGASDEEWERLGAAIDRRADADDDVGGDADDDGEEAEIASRFFEALSGPPRHLQLSPGVRLDGGGDLRGRTQMPNNFWRQPSYLSESSRPREASAGGQSSKSDELGRIDEEPRWYLEAYDNPISGCVRRPYARVMQQAYCHDGPRFRQRLLQERWLLERDVVLMAALRPSTETMLLTIARSDRWFFHDRVREALANNPFTPSWLIAALIPAATSTTRRVLTRHRDPAIVALAQLWQTPLAPVVVAS
jgi:hypothetical protein